jgi:hypothetical protein
VGKGGKRDGAGRPAGAINKATADIKALAQEYGEDAIRELATLMTTSESHQARIAAAKELLDRAYGKSRQAVDLGGPEGGPLQFERIVREIVDPSAKDT